MEKRPYNKDRWKQFYITENEQKNEYEQLIKRTKANKEDIAYTAEDKYINKMEKRSKNMNLIIFLFFSISLFGLMLTWLIGFDKMGNGAIPALLGLATSITMFILSIASKLKIEYDLEAFLNGYYTKK